VSVRIIDPILLTLFEFDVVTSENWEDTSEITRFPVESGLSITDHIIRQPVRLSLEGVVTNTPLPPTIPLFQRAQAAYERLRELHDSGSVVAVSSGLRIQESMGISSVGLVLDASTGDAIAPSVTLEEVRIVQSVTVAVPEEILRADVKAEGQSEADAGKQAPGAPDPNVAASVETTLAKDVTSFLDPTGGKSKRELLQSLRQ
jgi:hypothetical protein